MFTPYDGRSHVNTVDKWGMIFKPTSGLLMHIRSANTIDLEYLDDQKIEKDVPVSELRSSVIPGTHQHLAVGSRNRSNSKSFQPIGMEDGSGCAGEEGFLCTHGGSNDKAAHYVADAAGGLEHAAYVEVGDVSGLDWSCWAVFSIVCIAFWLQTVCRT